MLVLGDTKQCISNKAEVQSYSDWTVLDNLPMLVPCSVGKFI